MHYWLFFLNSTATALHAATTESHFSVLQQIPLLSTNGEILYKKKAVKITGDMTIISVLFK